MAFSAELGKLFVTVGSDTVSFTKGMDGVSKRLDSNAKQLRANVNHWGKWATGIGAAVVAAGAAVVGSNLTSIRELKNLSQAANETVAEFQRGAFAASQFGIEQEKFGDILKDVNDRVGDFITTGGGPMLDFFEQVAPKIGVTAEQFRGLSGQKALGLYVQSLEKANLSQEEMTFFMEAMASDSTRLLPLFRQNSKEMRALAGEAEKLGIGLSQVDVAAVELANRELAKSGAFMESLGQQFTVAVAPIITGLGQALNQAAADAGGFGNVIDNVMNFAVDAVGVFADGVHGVHVLFKGLEVVARGVIFEISKVFDLFIDGSIKEIGRSIVDFMITPFRKALEIAASFSDTAGEALVELDAKMTDIFGEPKKQLGEFAQAQKEAFEKAGEELETLMLKKLPSNTIADFVDDAQKKFKEEVSKRDVIDLTGGFAASDSAVIPQQTKAEKDEATRIREESEAILEALRERYAMTNETQLGQFETERQILQDHLDQKLITEQEAARLGKQIAEDEARVKNQILVSSLDAAAQALELGGKKVGKIQKGIAIVQAVVKGKQAAVDAWQAGMSTGGPFAPAVAASYAAASIAKTTGLINSIKSGGNSMSSAGGGAGGIVSGGGSTTGGNNAGGGAGQRNDDQVIRLVGSSTEQFFTTSMFRDVIVPGLNEARRDGVRFEFVTEG